MRQTEITMQSFILNPFFVVVADSERHGGANISTISYVGVLSENPPIVGLAIRPERLAHRLISEAKEFSLCMATIDLLPDLDFCGTFSGKTHSKIFVRHIEMEENSTIKTPAIKQSPVILECKLRNVLPLAKEGASHDYFVADVVAARREENFQIENSAGPVTTNYDYRTIGNSLGRAFHYWRDKQKGG